VVVGASDDKTGNIKYGGDWVLESTGEDVEKVYFTSGIEYHTYLLASNYNYANPVNVNITTVNTIANSINTTFNTVIYQINANVTNFNNNFVLLGGGAGRSPANGPGYDGAHAVLINSGKTITNLTNTGSLTGGGGSGASASGYGGAGGGGGGAGNDNGGGGAGGGGNNNNSNNYDVGGGGGFAVTNKETGGGGGGGFNGGGGGGGGGGSYNLGSNGTNGNGTTGGNGGNSACGNNTGGLGGTSGVDGASKGSQVSIGGGGSGGGGAGANGGFNDTTCQSSRAGSGGGGGANTTFIFGGKGGNYAGGGGAGGGNGGGDYYSRGGGGGSGGGLGGTGNSGALGGNGGFGIQNNGTITNLYNSQNLSGNYGPLYIGGIVPVNYFITILSETNYGQLFTSRNTSLKASGTVNFSVNPSSVFTLGKVYTNVLSQIAVSSTSGIFFKNNIKYNWNLTQNAVTQDKNGILVTNYDLTISEYPSTFIYQRIINGGNYDNSTNFTSTALDTVVFDVSGSDSVSKLQKLEKQYREDYKANLNIHVHGRTVKQYYLVMRREKLK
jgi:hypothetical protein